MFGAHQWWDRQGVGSSSFTVRNYSGADRERNPAAVTEGLQLVKRVDAHSSLHGIRPAQPQYLVAGQIGRPKRQLMVSHSPSAVKDAADQKSP
ncbi:MAG TPA: hypothetical protein DDX89_02130 [Candidatus Omnitrophica bacterium]|nr:hypothetical protein [Candidatus Omnitrophota bacterium]